MAAVQNPDISLLNKALPEFSGWMAQLKPFEQRPQLAVAVSGGADSMALLLLAHSWAQAQGGGVTALTIDHGLRSESAAEAAQVQQWCAAWGIAHHTLYWKPHGHVMQAQARQARYRLLADWCRDHHILHLLTANHRDDQVETLFFRLARGSGIDGLACMPALSDSQGIRLLRPLSHIPKRALEDGLAAAGQPWIEDPSNQNPKYTRNRIRHSLAGTPASEALHQHAAELVDRLGTIRNALENKLVSQLTECVTLLPGGYGLLHSEPFLRLAQDYALRTLSALTLTLSGETYPPRTEKLERFYREITGEPLSVRRTFGGLLFIPQKRHGRIVVCREPNAVAGAIEIAPGIPAMWDRRFRVRWDAAGEKPGTLALRALGRDGIKQLSTSRHPLPSQAAKPALSAFPSFWHLEELVSMPHIHYQNPAYSHLECSAVFCPAKPLAGPAFFSMNT